MKKVNKVLSVSVASYNLGEMIVENIESFCKCEVADKIELIITDDGSKDNTPKIIDEYAKKYPNTIVFVPKKNEGPGSTVNSGIKYATGKYFRMVDGDDWVKTENLKEYIELLEKSNADMIISNFETFDNEKKEVIEINKFNLQENVVFDIDSVYKKVPDQMHAITYKTSILKENNISLDNCFYTDTQYVLYPFPYVKTVEYFNKTIYMYRVAQATQSVNPNSMKKNISQHDFVLNNLINFYNKHSKNLSIGQRDIIISRIALMMNTQLTTLLWFDANKEQKEVVKNFINDMKCKCVDIYNKFKRSKKVKLLINSNYILYSILSKLCTKRAYK